MANRHGSVLQERSIEVQLTNGFSSVIETVVIENQINAAWFTAKSINGCVYEVCLSPESTMTRYGKLYCSLWDRLPV